MTSDDLTPAHEGEPIPDDLPAGLTPERYRQALLAARYLNVGATTCEASAGADVHRATLYRWRREPWWPYVWERAQTDELEEIRRYALRSLRQQIEDGDGKLSLAALKALDPRFQATQRVQHSGGPSTVIVLPPQDVGPDASGIADGIPRMIDVEPTG